MDRVGIYLDVSNLYYTIMHKYNGRKLSYKSYWDFVNDLGNIRVANAYGSHIGDQAKAFIHTLKSVGYTTRFKAPKEYIESWGGITRKADWDVGITVDIMNDCEELDLIVLGSADSDFAPLAHHLRLINKKVLVLATGISAELNKSHINCIEIPESLLQSNSHSKKGKVNERN